MLFIGGFSIISLSLIAQKVSTENTSDEENLYQTYGSNQKNFTHIYLGFGMFADQGATGADVNYGNTNSFQIGLRYKRKLNNTFSLGYDFSYFKQNFNIKQNASKTLPNLIINDSEKLVFNKLGLELYYRINIGKRGPRMGTFIDMGGYGNWAYRNKHVTRNDFSDDLGLLYGRRIVTNRKLKYTEPFNYGVRARFGFDRYALMAEYRLSDLFKEEFLLPELPELPKFQIALQIGIH